MPVLADLIPEEQNKVVAGGFSHQEIIGRSGIYHSGATFALILELTEKERESGLRED
jgi:hypothetical protein